jgi:two-component system response regulator FixJ
MAADAVIHLIDDDEAVRHSLSFFLGTAGFAVRTYETADAFLDALPRLQPGCVITDIRMPGMDGLALQRELKRRHAGFPVIVLSGHGDVKLAVEAMREGAVDFLEKPFDEAVLLNSLHLAIERHAETLGREGEVQDIQARLSSLSLRESQVLQGLVRGLANKAIAYELNLSTRTVEIHRANVMTKMAAGSLSALVRMVMIAQPEGRQGADR